MGSLGEQIWKAVEAGDKATVAGQLKRASRADLSFEAKFPGKIGVRTALMMAAHFGHTEIAEMLKNAGAVVDQQDSQEGMTALMWAVAEGRADTVQALLRWDAQVNLQATDGWTALMWAAYYDYPDIARILLKCGADKCQRHHKFGKTASDFAKSAAVKGIIDSYVATPGTAAFTKKVTLFTAEVEHAALEGECDTLGKHVAQAPARKDFMQKRDALLSQYNAARAAKPVDYAHLSTLGESLEALKQESAKVTLSEEDYLTLAARHAALVKKVKAKCDALLEAEQPDLLASLAAKLIMLQELSVKPLYDDVKGAKPAAEAALKPHDPAKLQRLQTECTTFTQQLAHAPARRDLMQRRDELAVRLKAAKSASNPDYILASKIMKEQQALEQESAQLPLSEKDYKTMGSRHTALVQQVQGMCEDLVAARQYRLLRDLAAQLTALRALDLSVLQDPSETDPVWVDEAAADPVHVARAPETADKVPAPRSIPTDGAGALVGEKAKESAKKKKEKCVVQ